MKGLSNACLPPLGVDWGRQILTPIGGHRLNESTRRLRISRLDMATYRKILSAIEISDNDESIIFSFDLEIWRRIIVRFNSNRIIFFAEWSALIRILGGGIITSPDSLKALSIPKLRAFSWPIRILNPYFNYGKNRESLPTIHLLLRVRR